VILFESFIVKGVLHNFDVSVFYNMAGHICLYLQEGLLLIWTDDANSSKWCFNGWENSDMFGGLELAVLLIQNSAGGGH